MPEHEEPQVVKERTLNVVATSEKDLRQMELEKYLSLINTLKGHEEFLLDDEGVIISSNLEAVNITGYEEYEIIGKHLRIFYTPEDAGKAEEDLRKAASVDGVVVTGIRLKKRGITFWAKMKIKPWFNDSQKRFFKVTLQDNTHRTLSRLKVQSFRDEFLAIFNNPFIGTFKFKKSDFKVVMCNQKALDITGQPNSDHLSFSQIFSCKTQWKQFVDLLENEKKVEGFQFIINDNRTLEKNWGLISARYFESQGFVGGVLMDISEQYHHVNELQRVNTELENFTYHASHDLRAPLTTIMGLANLGSKESSIDTVHHYFEMIQMRIQHMDTLLKDLVSISYNSKVEIKPESFNFKNEISALIEALQGPYPQVKVELSTIQPQDFLTDITRMRMILRNLFSNSLKYYNRENDSPYLVIKVKAGLTHAAIKIQDNGIGIERSYKDKIFDMFFRATTESTGSGLGLYIAKSMLEKLSGKIAVESTVKNGTTFLITVPNLNFRPGNN
ncbi:hypothetical protein WSM22_36780 [Cytophagales bacterium WSM2-2]|nr:hypothetical protein WSM22_36780 [Cytophagales bacterium WSM2-2]